VGNKMAFTIGKLEMKLKAILLLTKAMQILTDLNTKLLKTVTVNVLKSNYNRKVSDEMANVVKDSGEGRCFLYAGWCEEA
jgi:hypothetical protein